MKATEQIKRAAFEKTFDYFLSDPEHNVVKIMDLLDKVAQIIFLQANGNHFVMQLTIKTIGFSLLCTFLTTLIQRYVTLF